MMGLLVVLLAPPALFGLAVLAELARDRRRAARDRHPSSGHIGPPEEWL